MKKLAIIMKVVALISLAMFLGGGCEEEPLGDEATIGGSQNGGSISDKGDDEDEVTACFNLVNKFRTGNEAFYLNKDNTTTTNLVGELGKLTLDEELCKAAAIRAEEIVENFAHERPDGRGCFTVLDDLGIKAGYKAENIAMGNTSGEKTFLQWKEDGKPYSGQGHRRNMLSSSATKIGIAHDSSGRYWAMILSN